MKHGLLTCVRQKQMQGPECKAESPEKLEKALGRKQKYKGGCRESIQNHKNQKLHSSQKDAEIVSKLTKCRSSILHAAKLYDC